FHPRRMRLAIGNEAAREPRMGSGAMFDSIAGRYDLLNRLMSLGIDGYWRKAAVRALELGPRSVVLDLATGTGDVALEILRCHPDARVIGLDPSREMLLIARRKIAARGSAPSAPLTRGTAEGLPFADRSFDGACIAFGIRNVPDRAQALR